MPASSIHLYNMQDAKINFEAMRPAPVCTDTSMLMGHCQKIHISTNCYYGFHDTKSLENVHEDADCEMIEVPREGNTKASLPPPLINTRKRSADRDTYYPQTKRIREGHNKPPHELKDFLGLVIDDDKMFEPFKFHYFETKSQNSEKERRQNFDLQRPQSTYCFFDI